MGSKRLFVNWGKYVFSRIGQVAPRPGLYVGGKTRGMERVMPKQIVTGKKGTALEGAPLHGLGASDPSSALCPSLDLPSSMTIPGSSPSLPKS